MTSKIRRCTAKGCRTLTGNTLCDAHAAPSEPPTAAQSSVWDRITPEQWESARIRAAAQFEEVFGERNRRAARRADFETLVDGAEAMLRRFERPTFSEGSDHGI